MFNIALDKKIRYNNFNIVDYHCKLVIDDCKKKIAELLKINLSKEFSSKKGSDFEGINNRSKRTNAVNQFNRMLDWLNTDDNLEAIIKATPDKIMIYYEYIKRNFNMDIYPITKSGPMPSKLFTDDGIKGTTVRNMIEKIFDYESFSRKHAYDLTAKLNLKICPYCNREYIHTVIDNNGNKIARPELDHYFPKSKYPMFALSFYNLIPSGHICNSSVKGTSDLNLNDHLHPYIDEDKDFKFCLDCVFDSRVNIDNLSITIDKKDILNPKIRNTLSFFKIEELYQFHNNIADEICELYRNYPPERVDDIVEIINKSLNQNGIIKHYSKEDILKILYSKFIVKDPDREMLGKLRDDLYNQFKELY